MKNLIYIMCFAIIGLISCSDSSSPVDSDLHGFEFVKLETDKTRMLLTEAATLTATATGEELSYQWKASEGNLIGQGSSIQFTICHATSSRVSCTVTDKYNHSTSKSVIIESSKGWGSK